MAHETDDQPVDPNQPPPWIEVAKGVFVRPAKPEEITEERRRRSLPSPSLMEYISLFSQIGSDYFDRLHQLSLTSNVPLSFPDANRKIAGDMIAEILSTRELRPERENAYRLLERTFATETEASYAIWYCQAMSVFKAYDQAPEIPDQEFSFDVPIEQMAKHQLERWAERCASEVGVLEAGIQQPSGPPTFARRIRQRIGETVRRQYFKGKLNEVRNYCEDYFSQEQKRARITMIALSI